MEIPVFIKGGYLIKTGRNKLTAHQALAIYQSDLPTKTLAKLYDVDVSSIYDIKRKRRYKRYLPNGDTK
jgi:hypothetical protein